MSFEAAVLTETHKANPDLLTTGIREAYHHGLGNAFPVDGATLGWTMGAEGLLLDKVGITMEGEP